jgi:indolepyruvate ferredoxin oxidoreductase beta subunit
MTEPAGLRPTTILVSAIGGEGGGVLAGWIVGAARRAGYPVQSTSIPGVAQRTGATTYYIEIFPVPVAELGDRLPVMGIYPGIGDIDIMIASEFAETGRAIANGFVTPDRTLLIASTHRVYAINERGAMGDGRFDSERLAEAVDERARAALLTDFRAMAERERVSLNAILFGVLAAQGGLPMEIADFKFSIEETGVAVGANLKGFDLGHALSFAVLAGEPGPGPKRVDPNGRIAVDFPQAAHEILVEGVKRLADYQDPLYAALYLDRLAVIRDAERAVGGEGALVREAGRYLALRMSYEDVIRVAQLKSAPERMARIREEVRAGDDEPVVVIDYFKPGIEELCSILPTRIADPIMQFARRRGWLDRAYLGMKIKATSVFGYLRLRFLASLRRFRRGTWRSSVEQKMIEAWLDDVAGAAAFSLPFAMEVAATASLVNGYGDTFRRGMDNFDRIRDRVIGPALAGELPMTLAVDALSNARAAALADPEGTRLETVLAGIGAGTAAKIADAAE